MKRTSLLLDETLLDQATRALGAKTYSATVNLALEEVLRIKKIEALPQFFGSRIWRGNLAAMREDQNQPALHQCKLARAKSGRSS